MNDTLGLCVSGYHSIGNCPYGGVDLALHCPAHDRATPTCSGVISMCLGLGIRPLYNLYIWPGHGI